MSGRRRLRAAFYRGGTSKAVVFNGADLPADRTVRDRLFLHILGSPDPYGRQLDGMGGGLSSLSKVVVVEPSARVDADVDYTFVQIAVGEPVADYGSTCGNMSSAVGPFALEERMVKATGEKASVRIHNTNTGQIYRAEFPVDGGEAVEEGNFAIPGVSGTGAKIRLDFLAPGGAITGHLLPLGQPITSLDVAGVGSIDVSFVDAASPIVFVRADDVGCTGCELPQELDANAALIERMEHVRRAAAVASGMVSTVSETARSNPKIALIAPAMPFAALDGRDYAENQSDISVRMISMGDFHRAITLTGGMCTAVAAQIPGSLVAQCAGGNGSLRIGNPSGVLPVEALVETTGIGFDVVSVTTFRTQRRLMDGAVLVPASLLEGGP